MSVAVTSGVSPRGGGRLFFAPHAVLAEFRQSLRMRVSVFRGTADLLRMKQRRWMMTGNPCFRVSEVAAIMIASMWRMLSDMRKGE